MACKGMNLQSFRWLECMCFEMEGNHLALPKAMWHSLDCVTCSYFEVGSGHSILDLKLIRRAGRHHCWVVFKS